MDGLDQATEAFRAGNLLVAPKGVNLPRFCIQCGSPASPGSIKKRFAWHHPVLYLLLFLGVFPYAFALLFGQETINIRVSFCEAHLERYRKYRGLAITLLASALPIFFVSSAAWPEHLGWELLICIGMLLAGAGFLSATAILRTRRISQDYGIFEGASEMFLKHLQEAPFRLDQNLTPGR